MKLEPFRLERYFAEYEFNTPYLLSSSDCETFAVKELLDFEPGLHEKFLSQRLGYTESQGAPRLREQISGLYRNIHPSEVLVHTGAEEAIFIFMNAALDRGDHIIVHYPCYQSLFEVAKSIGCEVTLWETSETYGWELDIEFLESNIRKNTKAVIVNCPHNPTGYLMGREKFDRLVDVVRKRGIILFSDEVYRFLEYNEDERLPAACDVYEDAVSLGVMSKSFGLAGLRIGWVATRNREIIRKMAYFKDYTTICNSVPGEFLSEVALKHRDPIIRRNLGIIRKNLDLLDGFFERYACLFGWVRPKAGSIAFPHIKIDTGIENFCLRLVESKGVLLLPGTCYSYGDRNFRIGFGRADMHEALEKFEEFIRKYL